MKIAAIVLCGGSGTRFGSDKLIEDLGGRPVWHWAMTKIKESSDTVIVVDNGRKIDFGADTVVSGGATRQESVRNGLAAVPSDCEFVLIHDAARPLVSLSVIAQTIESARKHGAASAAVRVADTIRYDTGETLDRDRLWAIQTPQCARREDLIQAHQSGNNATDDAALLQAIGIPVAFVESGRENMKITTAEDLILARALIAGHIETRTGFGYDVHAFSEDPDRPMMLGGVRFEGPGLKGHSDADVLLHAIVDALLGAAGLGDIGIHYPPTDPQWKDCSSLRFLSDTGKRLEEALWKVENVDATLLAETPKIMPRSSEIREAIAEALEIASERVNVKATTNEELGSIGRREGIAAMAVATLRRT